MNVKIDYQEYKEQEEMENHVRSIIDHYLAKGWSVSYGRHRAGLIHPNKKYVLKIPLNDNGIFDNVKEARYFRRSKTDNNYFPMAACRVIYADKELGIPLLLMEYVSQLEDKDIPSWANFIDSQQVGRNKKGDVVAYDL